MAKTNKYDKRHYNNLSAYARQVEAVYLSAIKEAAAIGALITDFDPNRAFSFADYPVTRKRIKSLLQGLNRGLQTVIVNGIKSEWTLANNKNNEICHQVFGRAYGHLSKEQEKRYLSTNETARDAFIQRKTAGLRLSDRVWNYTNQFKEEIEAGLDLGIRTGKSADELSRDLRMFLKYPDKLFRRVRDEHGELQLSKNAAAFHPGQGVYRSSYKNARRLAVTECNMAYRSSDHLRWQQMDFVVGIEIEPSDTNHPVPDICDDLKGKYPKDFKWTGWHPHCRCHATPILKSEDEVIEDNNRIIRGEEVSPDSVNTVLGIDHPTGQKGQVSDGLQRFNSWIEDNRERAKGWASMPYFVRDNPNYVKNFRVDIYSPAEKKFTRAYHTSPAMKESVALFLGKKYPDIKNTEKAALIDYTRGDVSDFRHLNRELMKNSLSEFNVAFSELLSSALSKLPTEELTVYRTIRLNKTNLAKWKQLADSKAETVFHGYTSTSADLNVVNEFIEKKSLHRKKNETDILIAINGKTGHRITEFSKFPEQQELLFDKGMRLRFEGFHEEGGRIIFEMTEI